MMRDLMTKAEANREQVAAYLREHPGQRVSYHTIAHARNLTVTQTGLALSQLLASNTMPGLARVGRGAYQWDDPAVSLADRVAWFHAPCPKAALVERASTDTLAWRIYAYWHDSHPDPAGTTPERCRAEIARIPELALTGRHAPGHRREFVEVVDGVAAADTDWAAGHDMLTADKLARQKRSRHWRTGYELRRNQLTETLCYQSAAPPSSQPACLSAVPPCP
jgi:hypothetical protein